MALVQATEIKQTDPYAFFPATLNGVEAAFPVTASGTRVFIAPFNLYLLQMTVYTGAGAITSGETLRPAYGTSTGGITALGTTLGAATTSVLSSALALNIDTTATDAPLGPVIPAGSAIGVNHPTVALSTGTIIGVGIRYRMA